MKMLYRKIFLLSGHQSISWQLASIEIPAQTSSYRIEFSGKVGGSRNGDIAIDDFSVFKGKCQTEGERSFCQNVSLRLYIYCCFEEVTIFFFFDDKFKRNI